MNVVLYTRRGCHLCDEALAILQRRKLSPEIVDVDTDPALRAEFDRCVPVVAIDGKVRFRGRVNEALLDRLLARGERRGASEASNRPNVQENRDGDAGSLR